MLWRLGKVRIETQRLTLRLPVHSDFKVWRDLRSQSKAFLVPWEPRWSAGHLSRRAFINRVHWSRRAYAEGKAMPLFIIRREDQVLLGAITLDNIRRGPAQSGILGYWMGEPYARQGYMREAILALINHAFTCLDLSRIEAGCLPENQASQQLLEKCFFKYEGKAESYLQINGRWRSHLLYAALRGDRRGPTDTG